MYADHPYLRDNLKLAHANAWRIIGSPGDCYNAKQRINFVRTARQALECDLCRERRAAISPNAVAGVHYGQAGNDLSAGVVDMIHRLRTDPGRLTKSWFDGLSNELSAPQYVEIVSVVTTSVIIDTLHNALGYGLPALPQPTPGRPSQQPNEQAVHAGAWVPISQGSDELADNGLPIVPNIVRALGLLPNAVALFFGAFRPHYALQDINLSISQVQAEFVASRVSALNECFY